MNKIAMVFGVAAVATLAGCRDSEYDRRHGSDQNAVKNVPVAPAPAVKPDTPAPAPAPIVVAKPKCTCAPGTKHYKPCECGADDCLCVVVAKPVPPPAPETVTYVVQRGDYLAKISREHNVTIAAIKKLNPKIKGDNVWIGQKLKMPAGTVVAAPAKPLAEPVGAKKHGATKPAMEKSVKPYAGATKEYVVKNGDTLGAIAYSNGINIRQLKELNGLTSNNLKIGQKLKVPADGKAAAKPVEAKKPVAETKKPVEQKPTEPKPAEAQEGAPAPDANAGEPPVAPPAEDADAKTVAPGAAEEAPAPAAPAAVETSDYTVLEGDDLTQLSIDFGVSVSQIRQLNNMGPTDQVKAGQVIKLPKAQ